MCLLLFALGTPDLPLVVAANRDEFLARPTAPAAFWPEAPDVLAGRDLEGGGTWLGVTRTGRFAALTNFRDPSSRCPGAPSRGGLVSGFLTGSEEPEAYLARIAGEAERYNGFNLVAGGPSALFWFSNRAGRIERIAPGVHGLSNHLLDTPWPKVTRGRERLAALLARGDAGVEDVLALLLDRTRSEDALLPETGVGLEWERILSPAFIESPLYGTRVSTAVLFRADGSVELAETTHGEPAPVHGGETRTFRFPVEGG